MKAKDLAFTVVVIVLIALTPNSPVSVMARDVMADARPAPLAAPVGTAFTYQGQLMEGGEPADGAYDFQFTLYDAQTSGGIVGSPISVGDVVVSGGLFSVELDFGAPAFSGEARWLEIGVRPGGSSGSYTTLDPRQEITPAPYALYASNADTVDGQNASAFMPAGADNWVNTAGDTMTGALELSADAPLVAFRPTDTGSGDYGLWASKVGLYIRVDENYDGNWDTPTPLYFNGRDATFGGDVTINATADIVGSTGVIAEVRNTGAANSAATLRVRTNGTGYALEALSTNATNNNAAYFDGAVQVTGDTDVGGNLTVDGAAIGFFPRPAYDSGWVALTLGQLWVANHDLGGDVLDYLIDFQCGALAGAVANYAPLMYTKGGVVGTRYLVTSSQVQIYAEDVFDCGVVRLRIWVIN